jgi:hypothetical protein
MNKLLDSKQAQRLLKSLESDPRLQAPDDATILSDEQYPIAFDAAILGSRILYRSLVLWLFLGGIMKTKTTICLLKIEKGL